MAEPPVDVWSEEGRGLTPTLTTRPSSEFWLLLALRGFLLVVLVETRDELVLLAARVQLPLLQLRLELGVRPLLVRRVLDVTVVALLASGDLLKRLRRDRKSTRLNSSHGYISYAVF